MIDFTSFPHVLDLIIEYAPYKSLAILRFTCKQIRQRVDRRIHRHLVWDAKNCIRSYAGCLVLRHSWTISPAMEDALRVVDLVPSNGSLELDRPIKVDVVRQRRNTYRARYYQFFSAKTLVTFVPVVPVGLNDWNPVRDVVDVRINYVYDADTVIVHFQCPVSEVPAVSSLEFSRTIRHVSFVFSPVGAYKFKPEPLGQSGEKGSDTFLTTLAKLLCQSLLTPYDIKFTFVDLDLLPSHWLADSDSFSAPGGGPDSGRHHGPDGDKDMRTRFLQTVKAHLSARGPSPEIEVESVIEERLRFVSAGAWRAEVGAELYELSMFE